MGGNAVDQTYQGKPGRKPTEEYNRIMERTCWKIGNMFPWCSVSPVKAYANKESFGDGDILVERDELPADWARQLHKAFIPQNMVLNRFGGTPFSYIWNDEIPAPSPECFSASLDIQGLQVDLIFVNRDEFDTARVYYAFNDLGNFIGRIAERLGFTYGWDGLWKEVRVRGEVAGTILVSRDPRVIFNFLGYDFDRFKAGFNTMEEVYQYAASTKYFNRSGYLLENRNHKSRARDAKRASYNGFLTWLKDKPELDVYEWLVYDLKNPSQEHIDLRNKEKDFHYEASQVFFPTLKAQYEKIIEDDNRRRVFKEKWSGGLVKELTGYQNKTLGDFMKYCEAKWPACERYPTFQDYVFDATASNIEGYVFWRKEDFDEKMKKE